jgi:hypothetical protein
MPDSQMPFRASRFIDFNTGTVHCHPDLLAESQGTDPWSLKQEIDYFQCRVEVWQLSPAVEMLKQIESHHNSAVAWCHAAYGLLFILTSYFEMVGKILNPNSNQWRSGDRDFNFGFCDVYPTLPLSQPEAGSAQDRHHDNTIPHVAKIRDLMRNGLFHLGFTKRNFLIHNSPSFPLDFVCQPVVDPRGTADVYLMNPHMVIRSIVGHFGKFIDDLRDPANAARQQKFQDFAGKFHDENPKKA